MIRCGKIKYTILYMQVERKGDYLFNNILKNIGISDDPKTRRITYYSVCIATRIALYSYIALNCHRKWVVFLCFILGIFAAINLYQNLDGEQWWSRKFQFLISILLVLATAIILLTGNNKYNIIIPIILFSSLLGGVFQDIFLFGIAS